MRRRSLLLAGAAAALPAVALAAPWSLPRSITTFEGWSAALRVAFEARGARDVRPVWLPAHVGQYVPYGSYGVSLWLGDNQYGYLYTTHPPGSMPSWDEAFQTVLKSKLPRQVA